ncbi:uncharacterized protein J3R85_006000 [Psidium guajava]|nr:uncharacterized protein J3R85_006000 [Psidium guajava]
MVLIPSGLNARSCMCFLINPARQEPPPELFRGVSTVSLGGLAKISRFPSDPMNVMRDMMRVMIIFYQVMRKSLRYVLSDSWAICNFCGGAFLIHTCFRRPRCVGYSCRFRLSNSMFRLELQIVFDLKIGKNSRNSCLVLTILELIVIMRLFVLQHWFSCSKILLSPLLHRFLEPCGYLGRRRILHCYRPLVAIPPPAVPTQTPLVQRS